MTHPSVPVLALLIGVIAGLRAATPPAVVAWAAHRHWIDLHGSPLSFMGSTAAVIAFTLLAAWELVADKLPSTPNRTAPTGLAFRIPFGALAGAAVAAAGSRSS